MLFHRRKKDPGQLQSPSSYTTTENNSFTTFLRPRSSVVRSRVLRALVYLIALIFIILVEIGNLSDKPVLRDTYFIKIDLSHIIPVTVPEAALINSIARSIGLHDFYQVGLWNFCEGYDDGTGITYCSPPKKMYSFNPVEILMSELLAGATSTCFYPFSKRIKLISRTVALPGDIYSALDLARIASNWMFALFIVSAVLIFICMLLAPFSVSSTTTTLPPSALPSSSTKQKSTFKTPVSKKLSFPLTLLTFITFIITIAASVVATALFVVFKFVFANSAQGLNVSAELGARMLAFMWIAVFFTLLGFVAQCYELCSCCCCLCSGRQRRRRRFKKFVKEEKRNGTWDATRNGNGNLNNRDKSENGEEGIEMRTVGGGGGGGGANGDASLASGAGAGVSSDVDGGGGGENGRLLQHDGLHGLGRSRV